MGEGTEHSAINWNFISFTFPSSTTLFQLPYYSASYGKETNWKSFTFRSSSAPTITTTVRINVINVIIIISSSFLPYSHAPPVPHCTHTKMMIRFWLSGSFVSSSCCTLHGRSECVDNPLTSRAPAPPNIRLAAYYFLLVGAGGAAWEHT